MGRYDAENTIQLIDQNGNILGTAPVTASGSYTVQPSAPLAPGKYHLRVRAIDPNGDKSPLSPQYILVILPTRHITAKSAAPGGPLSL